MAESGKISRGHFIAWTFALAGLATRNSVKAAMKEVQGGSLVVNIDEYNELKEDGGFKILKNVTIGEITDSIIIVRKMEKEFLVFSSVCRHKKCNVKFKIDRDIFVCPCHDSAYDINGKVIKGPSKGDIPAYRVDLTDNQLAISTL